MHRRTQGFSPHVAIVQIEVAAAPVNLQAKASSVNYGTRNHDQAHLGAG
jgi:hypothetical protein